MVDRVGPVIDPGGWEQMKAVDLDPRPQNTSPSSDRIRAVDPRPPTLPHSSMAKPHPVHHATRSKLHHKQFKYNYTASEYFSGARESIACAKSS